MASEGSKMLLAIGSCLVILGGLSYWLGLWDRVDFKVHESLLPDKKELFILMAKCTKHGIGKHVMRLVNGSKKAIDASHANSSKMLMDAAAAYGCPPGSEALNVFLCFNDPKKDPGPRWAIGWAVVTKDFEEAKDMAKTANAVEALEEEIVAVRLGGAEQPILKGRLPWRHAFTPMIAPYFVWTKLMNAYSKGGYKSFGNNEQEAEVGLEVYVIGPKDRMEWIDYIVLFGDVKNIWTDTGPFPVAAKQ
jgi:hypothetical protein